MTKNLHAKPFDEGTKAKLAIFRDYLREWLPVFVELGTAINIFDFFAGPGTDLEGTKGTPLIILDELSAHKQKIKTKGLKVRLYFNEYEPEKCKELKARFERETSDEYTICPIDSLDFKAAFDKEFPRMQNNDCANLLFLDQSGVKHITEDVFRKIISLKRTDFLFLSLLQKSNDSRNINLSFNTLNGRKLNGRFYDQMPKAYTVQITA